MSWISFHPTMAFRIHCIFWITEITCFLPQIHSCQHNLFAINMWSCLRHNLQSSVTQVFSRRSQLLTMAQKALQSVSGAVVPNHVPSSVYLPSILQSPSFLGHVSTPHLSESRSRLFCLPGNLQANCFLCYIPIQCTLLLHILHCIAIIYLLSQLVYEFLLR